VSIAALMNGAAASAARATIQEPVTGGQGAVPPVAVPVVSGLVRRQRRATASTSTTNAGSIAADLSRYLPTEAVTLYTAILPFLVPKSTALSHQDYTSRWVLALGVGVFAVLYAVGLYKREVLARGGHFKWPPKTTITVVVAYAAWVCVIPGSALNSFGWYTPALGAVLGIAASAGIALFQLWFGSPEGG
jgi:hypothetical protein